MSKPWSEWGLKQWLTHLENRHTQEIQLGLARVLAVAKILRLDSPNSLVITVAGTNGKGSTVKALETIYDCAGYKVGTYSSPHLIDFNERIRVNLALIHDNELCQAFAAIEDARGPIALTYFETATLAALWHFAQLQLDVIILEVGLGGRLDATNIIDADLSIITTIDYDHQDYLGDTLEAIGYEKAGILRSAKPFIYADTNSPASVRKKGEELQAQGHFLLEDYKITEHHHSWSLESQYLSIELPKPKIQLKSAAAAVLATAILNRRLPVRSAQYRIAMERIFIAGRLQLVPGPITILYDVSHNAQSVRLLAEYLGQLKPPGRIHAVFSALKDKDIFNLIYPLKDCVNRWYPAQLDNKRALSADLLLAIFDEAEISLKTCYNSPFIAFAAALNHAKTGDLIVVYGSFFTVSQVMTSQLISWNKRRYDEIGIG